MINLQLPHMHGVDQTKETMHNGDQKSSGLVESPRSKSQNLMSQ